MSPITPPQINDQLPPITDMQHWNTRILRRRGGAWDGLDPDEFDPDVRGVRRVSVRWPRSYKQGRLDRT